jgi:hypothetical protein
MANQILLAWTAPQPLSPTWLSLDDLSQGPSGPWRQIPPEAPPGAPISPDNPHASDPPRCSHRLMASGQLSVPVGARRVPRICADVVSRCCHSA